jgi:histidyl-tRNA synthetase
MAEAILPARGFRDYLPHEKVKREAVLASIRRSYSKFGFREIETPAMEPLERLSSNQGGENEKLVFRVLRRGLGNDDMVTVGEACDLGMRYDLTVPLVRFYATHSHSLPNVFRALQIGPVWRAERPQKGRYRQFIQCDIDILGEASILAEVELINATLHALDELGVVGATVRLNDRRILDSVLAAYQVPAELRGKALIMIDKLDKIGVDGVCSALEKAGVGEGSIASIRGLLEVVETADHSDFELMMSTLPCECDPDGTAAVREIREAVLASNPAGTQVAFDPSLVRGMGYYTGPIFEIVHPSSSSSICGGGRYDAMGEQLFGRAVPACGFSIGFERIVGLVDEARFAEESGVLAIIYDGTPAGQIAVLQADYIRAGQRVLAAKRAKNLSKQLSDLGAQGVTHFCIVEGEVGDVSAIEVRPLTR